MLVVIICQPWLFLVPPSLLVSASLSMSSLVMMSYPLPILLQLSLPVEVAPVRELIQTAFGIPLTLLNVFLSVLVFQLQTKLPTFLVLFFLLVHDFELRRKFCRVQYKRFSSQILVKYL
jgi:hypothetical protein